MRSRWPTQLGMTPTSPFPARLAVVQARVAELHRQATAQVGGRAFATALAEAYRGGSSTATPAVTATGTATLAAHDAPAGDAGARAVDIARRQLGTPYVWGAEDPATGFDCSGLVQYTFRQLGVDLPRVSRDQARVGRAVASLDQARPGDLVAFGSPVDHIGIYAGGNTMVVAPQAGDVVKLQQITRPPTAIRRVV